MVMCTDIIVLRVFIMHSIDHARKKRIYEEQILKFKCSNAHPHCTSKIQVLKVGLQTIKSKLFDIF